MEQNDSSNSVINQDFRPTKLDNDTEHSLPSTSKESDKIFNAYPSCSFSYGRASSIRVRTALQDSQYHNSEENRFRSNVEFVEKPRQLVILSLLLASVAYWAFQFSEPAITEEEQNKRFRIGVGALSCCFLVHCFLQCRDTLLVRPHPGLWRIVHGCGMLYMFFLVVLILQPRSDAKQLLGRLFPDTLVVPSAAGIHTSHTCEITPSRIVDEFTEIWFYCHIIGWFSKMCIFRDWTVCWILSIGFELLELALGWFIPQFNECWWDSVIMDALIANLTGMTVGHYALKFLESHQYNWGGYKQPTGRQGVNRMLHSFYPLSWSRWNWEALSSFKRFAQVGLMIIGTLAIELNGFMFLNTLAVPKESNINMYRLFLLAFLGFAAISEHYEFISNPACVRIGQNMWAMIGIFQLELIMWAKFLPQKFIDELDAPKEVTNPCLLSLALFTVWCLLFFSLNKPEHDFWCFNDDDTKTDKPGVSNTKESVVKVSQEPLTAATFWQKAGKFLIIDLLLFMSIAPLFYLFPQWHY